VSRIRDSLNHNYGMFGLRVAEYIGRNRSAILTEGKEIEKDFAAAVKFQDQERFWLAICVAILEAAAITNTLLPEPTIHMDEVYVYLLGVYKDQRRYVAQNVAVGGTRDAAVNALSDFFNSSLEYQLWTINIQKGKGRQPVTLIHMDKNDKNDVWTHWARDDRMVQISKKRLMAYLQEHWDGSAAIFAGLTRHFKATTLPRISLTAGVFARGQAAEPVIQFRVEPGSEFEDNLLSHSTNDEIQMPSEPMPGSGTGIETAMAAAAADLALVRGMTGPAIQPDQ
jgi:hypothetical protein